MKRVLIAGGLVAAAHTALFAALPLYLTQVGLTPLAVGVVVGAYGVSGAGFRLLGAGVVDRRDPTTLLRVAALLYAAAFTGYWLLPAGIILVVPRLLHGLAHGLFYTTTYAWITHSSSNAERGKHIGWFTSLSGIAVILMPAVGLYALEKFGASVLFAGGLALVLLVFAVRLEPPPSHSVQEDAPRGGLGILLAVTFLLWASFGLLEAFLPAIARERGVGSLIPIYVAFAVVLTATRIAGGSLSDRVGRKPIILIGMALAAVGFAALAAAHDTTGFIVAALLYGTGCGGGGVAAISLIADRSTSAGTGRTLGFSAFLRDIGAASGAMVGGVAALAGTASLVALGVALGAGAFALSCLLVAREWRAERPPLAAQLKAAGTTPR